MSLITATSVHKMHACTFLANRVNRTSGQVLRREKQKIDSNVFKYNKTKYPESFRLYGRDNVSEINCTGKSCISISSRKIKSTASG